MLAFSRSDCPTSWLDEPPANWRADAVTSGTLYSPPAWPIVGFGAIGEAVATWVMPFGFDGGALSYSQALRLTPVAGVEMVDSARRRVLDGCRPRRRHRRRLADAW